MAQCLEFTLGSSWDIDLVFTDEAGAPEDVTEDTFSVINAKPEAIENAEFTKTDAEAGEVRMHLAAEHVAGLRVGGNYSFRVSRVGADDSVENTTTIAVHIV